MTKNLVLVHGAWHGPWCWNLFSTEMAGRGWNVIAVDLPSAGNADAGLYDDADAVRKAVAGVGEPAVVLSHSYGGLPTTEAAALEPNARQLIFLSAHMFREGESLVSPLGGPWWEPGTRLIDVPDGAREALFHDVPDDLAAYAISRLRPQSARSFEQTLTRTSWQTLPSAYILCEDDRILPKPLWRRADDADVKRTIPGSHSPFLACPEALADVVEEITSGSRA